MAASTSQKSIFQRNLFSGQCQGGQMHYALSVGLLQIGGIATYHPSHLVSRQGFTMCWPNNTDPCELTDNQTGDDI